MSGEGCPGAPHIQGNQRQPERDLGGGEQEEMRLSGGQGRGHISRGDVLNIEKFGKVQT